MPTKPKKRKSRMSMQMNDDNSRDPTDYGHEKNSIDHSRRILRTFQESVQGSIKMKGENNG